MNDDIIDKISTILEEQDISQEKIEEVRNALKEIPSDKILVESTPKGAVAEEVKQLVETEDWRARAAAAAHMINRRIDG